MLTTERLRFDVWSEDKLPLAEALWCDAEVTRFIGGPFTREQVQARVAREMANFAAHGVQYWPIFKRESGEHAGCCGLRPYDLDARVFALGFHLLPQHWGKGYAREASLAVIEHAFTSLDASKLFAGHHPQNERSRKTLVALGFEYWRDELYPPTGLMHPSYLLMPSRRYS